MTKTHKHRTKVADSIKPQRNYTKTFNDDSGFEDVVNFLFSNIETEDREVYYVGAEPSMDVVTNLKHKYTITITRHDKNS